MCIARVGCAFVDDFEAIVFAGMLSTSLRGLGTMLGLSWALRRISARF